MNTIWIVMPILIVLMFLLGTDLNKKSFTDVARNPRAVLIGMIGQIIILPVIAFALAWALKLPPVYFMGIVLVACCPGGSSSNVFSMLAKGDVALSVTLTAVSSILTLFTIPVIMEFVARFVSEQSGVEVNLPFGKLIVQNIVLIFVPLIIGILFRHWLPEAAAKVNKVLSKLAFPALMTLAAVFFLQYTQEIKDNFAVLGIAVTVLILLAMLCSSALSRITKSSVAVRRTIIIEVGMQNAAQAIAIASSPFIFNSGEMALPAIIYALLMNVILLTYVGVIKFS
ncbi:MAG: bile acid:sodium symporter family protein [Bacteroidales bacterium]|nr:bile acid:sodium symporter family protein [Bacteroidales bacterium]MBO5854162.1 bile acid:sodium symporter family protein [Bacteroidales bacterium]